jgi:hypothetical protein
MHACIYLFVQQPRVKTLPKKEQKRECSYPTWSPEKHDHCLLPQREALQEDDGSLAWCWQLMELPEDVDLHLL